ARDHHHGEAAALWLRPGLRDGLLCLSEDLPQPVLSRVAEPAPGPGTHERPGPRADSVPGYRAGVRGREGRQRHTVEQPGSQARATASRAPFPGWRVPPVDHYVGGAAD